MKYDILVVGSGPGGYVAAIRAAQLGKKVGLVERAEAGGVCLNWGCIPTKALLKSARTYAACRAAAQYGIEVEGEVRPSLEKIVARSREVAAAMNRGVQFLLKKNGIDLIAGLGRLTAPGRLDVDGTDYEADHIILATGARPREMPFMPVDGERVITSRQALALTRLPESMIVVGSGAIGSELACFYALLGVRMTVVEYLPRMMPLEDKEVSKAMERAFRKLRATVLTATTVRAVKAFGDCCEVAIEGKRGAETLTADVVLSAVGIEANIEGIGLEELGVKTERGRVVVDAHYRTSVPGIWAVGDIVPGPALAHVASAEAVCCVETICGLDPAPVDYAAVPSCIFTVPEVASVGMTEAQAAEKGIAVKIGRFPFTASGKATASGDRDGFVKLIFDEEERLLGAHMVGEGVTEMLAEPTLALRLGAAARDLIRTIHAHPTMSEAILEAAEAAVGQSVHL